MYNLIAFCHSSKYDLILPHWINRINLKCKDFKLTILRISDNFIQLNYYKYAWWDVIRMKRVIDLLENDEVVVHCDLDIIIQKNIQDLVDLKYDFIISHEIGGENAFPKECSNILGFGICSGFYIAKPTSLAFLKIVLENMLNNKYNINSYSDQETIMNIITKNNYNINYEDVILDNTKYTNKIITVFDIKICVLDFEIIRRDPIKDSHYGMHINIDNVDGVHNFLNYFYEKFETLKPTCKCSISNIKCEHLEHK